MGGKKTNLYSHTVYIQVALFINSSTVQCIQISFQLASALSLVQVNPVYFTIGYPEIKILFSHISI